MGEMRNSYIISVKKFKEHRPLDTLGVDGRVLISTSKKHGALGSITLI
jgi:hypothetical protein